MTDLDELDPQAAGEYDATAGVRDFIVENMTSNEIKSMAFEIGIDPNDLDGDLPVELAQSLVLLMAQRNELQLLDRALRDLQPVEYGKWFRAKMD
jgi:hypothetical protein